LIINVTFYKMSTVLLCMCCGTCSAVTRRWWRTNSCTNDILGYWKNGATTDSRKLFSKQKMKNHCKLLAWMVATSCGQDQKYIADYMSPY